LFLDHNFSTRRARKLIKGSKDSDSSLVSNENLSEILWPSGLDLGQVTRAQKRLRLWRRSQNICNPLPKNFFWVQTKRLAPSSEPLNSSPAQSAELWRWQGNRQLLVLGRF